MRRSRLARRGRRFLPAESSLPHARVIVDDPVRVGGRQAQQFAQTHHDVQEVGEDHTIAMEGEAGAAACRRAKATGSFGLQPSAAHEVREMAADCFPRNAGRAVHRADRTDLAIGFGARRWFSVIGLRRWVHSAGQRYVEQHDAWRTAPRGRDREARALPATRSPPSTRASTAPRGDARPRPTRGRGAAGWSLAAAANPSTTYFLRSGLAERQGSIPKIRPFWWVATAGGSPVGASAGARRRNRRDRSTPLSRTASAPRKKRTGKVPVFLDLHGPSLRIPPEATARFRELRAGSRFAKGSAPRPAFRRRPAGCSSSLTPRLTSSDTAPVRRGTFPGALAGSGKRRQV